MRKLFCILISTAFAAGCTDKDDKNLGDKSAGDALANQKLVANTVDSTKAKADDTDPEARSFQKFKAGLANLSTQQAKIYEAIYKCDSNLQDLEWESIPKSGLVDKSSNPPLLIAAERKCTEAVRLLLEHGVDVNEQDGIGHSALHYSVAKLEIASLLLSHQDINVNPRDIHKKTPLIWLTTGANNPNAETEEILQLLLRHTDIDVNAADHTGQTALMYLIDKPWSLTHRPGIDDPDDSVKFNKYRTMLAYFLALPKLDREDVVTALYRVKQKNDNSHWALDMLERATNAPKNAN